VFKEPSGRAVNNYELWAEDIDLAKGLGLNAYRFSVEWARVEPVEGKFSDEELDHYEAIVDRCVELGLAPVVTLNHFTAPHWFAMRSGWLDPEAPALFARYCDKVVERFGDRIAYAVTLNEPNLAHLLTWFPLPDFIKELDRATLGTDQLAQGPGHQHRPVRPGEVDDGIVVRGGGHEISVDRLPVTPITSRILGCLTQGVPPHKT
jgi:beta-glucosidase